MPIRFRCAYCNQLMGIARRKAGTVVSCPQCNGQVVVPTPDPGPGIVPPPGPPPGGGIFDASDFGPDLFVATGPAPAQALAPPPVFAPFAGNNPPVAEGEFDVIPFSHPGVKPRGLVLSPVVFILVSILVFILMGLAFVVGLLVGHSK